MHLHLNKWRIVLIYQLLIAIQSDENHSPLNKDPFFEMIINTLVQNT